ncbi:AraC family transcriptional regulator [Gynuella sunshinyii]|uniref:DNA gyrase inhibitor n=1 Tax=Gynuella sunshinyii YC6258 TaxID=1445510 RepID=A0A0C5VFM0_9GAMM|nr:GyrI-like domain-containing protein [Gynuella sunshinyii]AJQ93357.1 DNA gyrase inhibitor [Gynuella sunshinyii YC6258]
MFSVLWRVGDIACTATAAQKRAYRDDNKIVDIALANGYESHEAFSRAFKNYFDKSPFEFRKTPDWTPWHSKYEPVLQLRNKIMSENPVFNMEVVDFPETLIAVMEHRGAPDRLAGTLQKFIEWRKLNHLPPKKSRTFNLVYDDPNVIAAKDYRFDICCSVNHEVGPNDHGIVNKIIPAGKCARIRYVGSDDAIGVAINFLYSKWLSDVRDFPVFLERVHFFPDVPESEAITDIYLPVE